jgi:tetratricopeptide (TPR) repeat protein
VGWVWEPRRTRCPSQSTPGSGPLPGRHLPKSPQVNPKRTRIRPCAILAFSAAAAFASSGCATRYAVKSFPEGATVFVKDIVTQEKKLVGQTPLTLKKTKEMGEVFFFEIEKDNFYPKQILMTPRDGESLTVSVVLDPNQDRQNLADGKDGNKGEQKGQSPEEKKKQDAKDKKDKAEKEKAEEAMRDLNMRIALLENTVSMYKDALFSQRYSGGGPAKFDRDRNDQIVDHLFRSQQLVVGKKYPEALGEIDKALMMDEYLPQAYLIKGSIFYVNKQFDQAKIAWERALKVDPYNAQAYNYLRLVDRKLGVAAPPDRPSQLRMPATDEFSRSIREIEQGAAKAKQ